MGSKRPWFICSEVVERVTAWMDEALPTTDRLRFRLHLTHCNHCRTFVEQIQETAETCRRLGETSPVAAALPPRLQEHFREFKRKRGDDDE